METMIEGQNLVNRPLKLIDKGQKLQKFIDRIDRT